MNKAKQTMLFSPDTIKQPTIVRPKNLARLVFILILLNLTTFYCGYCIAYITALGANNLILIYGSSLANPVIRACCIASIPYGVCSGTFLAIYVIPLTTRKKLIFILSILGLIFQGVIQIKSLIAFFICRAFQGSIGGIFLILIPIYLRQISPKQINKRGIFGVSPALFLAMGIMMAFVFNTFFIELGLDQQIRWRIIISLNIIAIVGLIICCLLNIIPQSPHSLIGLGKQEQAKKVIGIFHREKFIDQIYKQKIQQIQAAKVTPPPPKIVDKKSVYQKTYLTFGVPIMQQLTGVNAYISQMGLITSAFNIGFGNYVPAIMGFVQWFSALISMYYLYRFQRRKMLLIGNLGTSLCSYIIGITFFFIQTFDNGFWIVVTSIILFMGFNGIFLIPSVPLYLPTVGTKVQLQYTQVTNWFSCGTAVILLPIIDSYFGFSPMFITFGTISLIFFLINLFFMIDTKPDVKKSINDQIKEYQLKSVIDKNQLQIQDSWRKV